METTEDQRRNLEVDSIDCTQPVQFNQGWRYVVRPPQIEDRSCRRVDDGTADDGTGSQAYRTASPCRTPAD